MPLDATTMTIVSTIVTMIGATGGGILTYVKTLHNNTVQELRSHNVRLDKRAEECEADRKELHHRINEQSERITSISSQLANLKGKFERNKEE